MRESGHVLEPAAEGSRGDPAGKGVDPAGGGENGRVKNLLMEAKNAAVRISLFINHENKKVLGST